MNLLLFSLIVSNPLRTPEPVGNLVLFDDLLFAYAIPAIFGALFYRAFRRRELNPLADVTGIASLVLGFIYLSFEVRHFFQGAILSYGVTSDAEWYVYSAVWLLYGVGVMVTGIVFGHAKLRMAGLAIGAVVLSKVFLFDMATLSGLYRAASFLGLGASLIGLGYLHQRLAQLTPPIGANPSQS